MRILPPLLTTYVNSSLKWTKFLAIIWTKGHKRFRLSGMIYPTRPLNCQFVNVDISLVSFMRNMVIEPPWSRCATIMLECLNVGTTYYTRSSSYFIFIFLNRHQITAHTMRAQHYILTAWLTSSDSNSSGWFHHTSSRSSCWMESIFYASQT